MRVFAIAIAIALCTVAAALADAAPAQGSPARFMLEKCDSALPGGGLEGAVFTGTSPYEGWENCAESGGALIIRQGGGPTTTSAYWSLPLPPPPGGFVESVTVTAELCSGSNQDAETVAFAIQGGWPLTCAPEARTFGIDSTAGSAGELYLGCAGYCEEDPFAWAHYFAATEVDPIPPVVEGLGGTALGGGPLHGHQTLTATATDVGGGVSNVTLAVNGQSAAAPVTPVCKTASVANTSVVGTVATTPTPCPPEVRAAWSLDTTASPFHEGTNQVQVCATDFATLGPPNRGCSAPVGVDVDNSCTESPVAGGNQLDADFARTGSEATTVDYGREAEVQGTLGDQAGNGVSGATICVEAQTQGDSQVPQSVAVATTDAAGTFSFKVPPGPDRHLLVGYRHDSFQVARTLSVDTHARPALGVSPRHLGNGQRVRLAGHLAPPRAAGRVVVLQANVPGSGRWITFRKATSDRQGDFSARYRFNSTTRRTTYRFRALVPRQAGYPWLQGTSEAVPVTVTR